MSDGIDSPDIPLRVHRRAQGRSGPSLVALAILAAALSVALIAAVVMGVR